MNFYFYYTFVTMGPSEAVFYFPHKNSYFRPNISLCNRHRSSITCFSGITLRDHEDRSNGADVVYRLFLFQSLRMWEAIIQPSRECLIPCVGFRWLVRYGRAQRRFAQS